MILYERINALVDEANRLSRLIDASEEYPLDLLEQFGLVTTDIEKTMGADWMVDHVLAPMEW